MHWKFAALSRTKKIRLRFWFFKIRSSQRTQSIAPYFKKLVNIHQAEKISLRTTVWPCLKVILIMHGQLHCGHINAVLVLFRRQIRTTRALDLKGTEEFWTQGWIDWWYLKQAHPTTLHLIPLVQPTNQHKACFRFSRSWENPGLKVDFV